MVSKEIRIDDFGQMGADALEPLQEAIDGASDQDTITWLVGLQGKRIAAIVPVDVAEAHEVMIAEVLATRIPPRVQFPQVTVTLTGHDSNTGAIMGTVTDALWRSGVSAQERHDFRLAVFACDSYESVLKLVARTVNVR